MKLALPIIALLTLLLTGCSFDASSRPVPPASPTVITQDAQAYCCATCEVDDEQAVCDGCRRTNADICASDAARLLCVSNRVEQPQTETTSTVTCY